MDFRIESSDKDKVLNVHIEGANKNDQYTSPQIQNELIGMAHEVLRIYSIVTSANNSNGYSALLMIRQIYQTLNNSLLKFDLLKAQICEEFIGFIPLDEMDATTIADSIIDKTQKNVLDLDKMHGQCHDGCKTITVFIPYLDYRLPDPYPIL